MMADAADPSTAAAGRARHHLPPDCWARSPSAALLMRAKLLLARNPCKRRLVDRRLLALMRNEIASPPPPI
jgi:hypothetical protein